MLPLCSSAFRSRFVPPAAASLSDGQMSREWKSRSGICEAQVPPDLQPVSLAPSHHNPPQPSQLPQSSPPASRLQALWLIWSYTHVNWKATVTENKYKAEQFLLFSWQPLIWVFHTQTGADIHNAWKKFSVKLQTWFLYIQKLLEGGVTDIGTDGHTALGGWVSWEIQLKYHFYSGPQKYIEFTWFQMMAKSAISTWNNSEWNPTISNTVGLRCLSFFWPMCQCESLCCSREGEGKSIELKNGRKMPCEHLDWTQRKAFKWQMAPRRPEVPSRLNKHIRDALDVFGPAPGGQGWMTGQRVVTAIPAFHRFQISNAAVNLLFPRSCVSASSSLLGFSLLLYLCHPWTSKTCAVLIFMLLCQISLTC